jgi:hypothetical protein
MRRLAIFIPNLPLMCRPILPVISRLQASQEVEGKRLHSAFQSLGEYPHHPRARGGTHENQNERLVKSRSVSFVQRAVGQNSRRAPTLPSRLSHWLRSIRPVAWKNTSEPSSATRKPYPFALMILTVPRSWSSSWRPTDQHCGPAQIAQSGYCPPHLTERY